MLNERDWVMRVVKQLAELIARALKLGDEKKRDEAIEVLQSACGSVLGMEYRVLAMLDAHAAVDLLGTAERAMAFAQLLEAMGDVELSSAEALRAQVRFQHALELVREVCRRWPQDAGAKAALARLEARE